VGDRPEEVNMSRATRARRIAATAAFGGGGLGALAGAAYGLIKVEAGMARRWIGQPFGDNGPGGDGVYGAGTGLPILLAMLGDSSSVGLGVDKPSEAPGAVMAAGLATITGRPVHLQTVGIVGAESTDLPGQVADLLATCPNPDVAVIMVGANDVTHRIRPAVAVRALDAAVRRLREVGCEVVVGTCPDLGTIEPLAFPLNLIARRSSRQLAAAQTIATVEAGGRTVSLGDLLGAEFSARPKELFSADGFHPSAAGYARAAETMLPSVAAALGYWPDGTYADDLEQPVVSAGERVDDIANAAVMAADVAGTEVSGTAINGAQRGPRGRWAVLLRRRRASVSTADVPGPADNAEREAALSDGHAPESSPTSGTTVAGATAAEGQADLPAG
jgi:lysophospholipase L1-like esterase